MELVKLLPVHQYSKTCLKRPLKTKTKIGFQDRLLLNAGQKYCRMLQGEHSAILSTFIKLQFVIKIFVLSIFEWPFKTGFTVKCWYFSYSGPSGILGSDRKQSSAKVGARGHENFCNYH